MVTVFGILGFDMHLIYIDEVKYDPPDQPFYWLCGFAINQTALRDVDAELCATAQWYFDRSDLSPATEFHASYIVNGKGAYKGKDLAVRTELMCRLVSCLCMSEEIKRIEVRIDPSKITHGKDPAETAFMFFSEKADGLMRALDSIGVLIADKESKKVSAKNVSSLSHYRDWSTPWAMGRQITNLVDSIHHTQSHHSRLVQLADIFVYCCQLQGRDGLKHPKSVIKEHASSTGLYNAAKYKHWPTDQSYWYQASRHAPE